MFVPAQKQDLAYEHVLEGSIACRKKTTPAINVPDEK